VKVGRKKGKFKRIGIENLKLRRNSEKSHIGILQKKREIAHKNGRGKRERPVAVFTETEIARHERGLQRQVRTKRTGVGIQKNEIDWRGKKDGKKYWLSNTISHL